MIMHVNFNTNNRKKIDYKERKIGSKLFSFESILMCKNFCKNLVNYDKYFVMENKIRVSVLLKVRL